MARQELVNLEPYLSHRTKINDMTEELYNITADSRVIYCSETAPLTGGDGSIHLPFQQINEAIAAVIPGSSGGSVIFTPGTYPFAAGTIDVPPNISLLNPYGRGQVNIETSIITDDTISQFEKIRFAPMFGLTFGDGIDSQEIVTMVQCDVLSTADCSFLGGSSGFDSFVFTDAIFGTDGDTARTKIHIGAAHIFDACYFSSGTQTFIGSDVPTTAPLHAAKFTNCVFNRIGGNGRLIINGEAGKITSVIMFACEFADEQAILFNIALTGSVNLELDQLTYNEAVAAGTNFDVEGLTVEITDLSQYEFTTTVINDTITTDPFQEVATLGVSFLQKGIYEIKLSMVWNFLTGELNDQLIFEITGNVSSPQFRVEAKDDDDSLTWSYIFPFTQENGGAFSMTLQAMMETGGDDAIIEAANIMIERKV